GVVLAGVPAAGGTADQVRATVPDAWFGVGRFGTYGAPWNSSGQPTVVFEHVLSPTIDNAQLTTALTYGYNQTLAASAYPRAWGSALYAIATPGGLPSAVPASPWVLPRASWSSPTTPSSG